MEEVEETEYLLSQKIKLGEDLEILKNNVLYKSVIEDYLLKECVLELNLELANFSLTEEQRNAVILKLTALSTLQNYIKYITVEGNSAKYDLSELKNQIRERNIDE